MTCLTEKDLIKAVELDGQLSFDGKKLELRAAEKKKSKDDRDNKKKHHHNKDYENGNQNGD